MMDTSALVAALIEDHEHHALSRAHLAPDIRFPAIVLAETFAQLRRTFGQSAATAVALVRPWAMSSASILATTASAVSAVMARAVELDLAGNIHDALIAQVCAEHKLPMVTLDSRQHRLALALGTRSTYLLA